MLDIGPIHRREYELDGGRQTGKKRTVKGDSRTQSAKIGKNAAKGAAKGAKNAVKGAARGGVGRNARKVAVKGAAKGVGKSAEPVIIAQSPGRIHFLGEHGDPSAGLYLSAAIDRWMMAAISVRKDNALRFYAADLGERKRTTLANLKYKREDRWANYVKTAIHVFVELGLPVKGLNCTITGNIPQQIGLAASSALEVAAAVALKGLFRAKISNMELAQRLAASHELFFEEKPSMADYMIGLLAKNGHFLLVDESNLTVTAIKSPFPRCKYIMMDSRVPRLGVDTELTARKNSLETGLEMLSQGREGASFREFAAMDLMDSMGNFPEEIRRRSLHVVEEIRRVLDAADCLERADLAGFSRLVFHSHESLRDLFEVSCPEIDWMVKRAQETEGVFGARMTGQGFGGCTYTIIKNEAIKGYRERMDEYERIFGFQPGIYELKLAAGSKVVGK